MAGTLQRAGAQIVRRATAAGLGGLAVAIFVGVMAFAFTTTPADRDGDEARATGGTTQFLANTTKATELRTLSAMRSLIQEATTVAFGDGDANDQPHLASREGDDLTASAADLDGLGEGLGDGAEDGAFVEAAAASAPLEPTTAPPTAEASPTAEPGTHVVAAALAVPAGDTPELQVGDRVQATISFYYCERGERGLHPGDGGRFCGAMRNGDVVYPGAAACAYAYLGQRFRIEGDSLDRVYTCADTGSAVHGLHRDIWFMTSDEGWSWQLGLGQRAVIEIVE